MHERWMRYTRRYEGLNVFPYTCPTGHLTIGYGHNLAWWQKLNEVRQFVLVDMCFNMGLAKLTTFKKMLHALKQQDYQAAAREMLDSRWAGQVGHRAQELASMMKTGEYYD